MAGIFLCEISAVHEREGTVDMAVTDRDGMIITDVPMLDIVYEMPKVGEVVAALFEEKGATIQRGIMIGRPYSAINRPGQSGAGIFCKEFRDGAYVKYDANTRTMEVNAENLRVKNLSAEHILYKTACEKG